MVNPHRSNFSEGKNGFQFANCHRLPIEKASGFNKVPSNHWVLSWFYYGFTMVLLCYYDFTWFYYGFTMVLLCYYGFTVISLWFYHGFTMPYLITKATSPDGQVSMAAELTGSLITPRRRCLRRRRGRAADLPSRPHLLGENHLEIWRNGWDRNGIWYIKILLKYYKIYKDIRLY